MRTPENCIDVTLCDENNPMMDALDVVNPHLKKEPKSTAVESKYDSAEHKSLSCIAQKCKTAMRFAR